MFSTCLTSFSEHNFGIEINCNPCRVVHASQNIYVPVGEFHQKYVMSNEPFLRAEISN